MRHFLFTIPPCKNSHSITWEPGLNVWSRCPIDMLIDNAGLLAYSARFPCACVLGWASQHVQAVCCCHSPGRATRRAWGRAFVLGQHWLRWCSEWRNHAGSDDLKGIKRRDTGSLCKARDPQVFPGTVNGGAASWKASETGCNWGFAGRQSGHLFTNADWLGSL